MELAKQQRNHHSPQHPADWGVSLWTQRSPQSLLPLLWTNLKATAAISGHKADNQEWSSIIKSAQGTAPFSFLRATAFLVWCWKTAPASKMPLREKGKGREQQRQERSPGKLRGAPAAATVSAAPMQHHQAPVQHRCCQNRVRPRKRVPCPVSEPCQVPPGFVYSLVLWWFWAREGDS